MTTKDKEILELAQACGFVCRMQCQECPVNARFEDESEGDGPFLIVEDGKSVDCTDYFAAIVLHEAGYRKQSKNEQKIKKILEKYTTLKDLDVLDILGLCESIIEDRSEKGGEE